MMLDTQQDAARNWKPEGLLIVAGPPVSGLTTALAAIAIVNAESGKRVLAVAPSKSLTKLREALLKGFVDALPALPDQSDERSLAYDYIEGLMSTSLASRSALIKAADKRAAAKLRANIILPYVSTEEDWPTPSTIESLQIWVGRRLKIQEQYGKWNEGPFASLIDITKRDGIEKTIPVIHALGSLFEKAVEAEVKLPSTHQGLGFGDIDKITSLLDHLPDETACQRMREIVMIHGDIDGRAIAKIRAYLAAEASAPASFQVTEDDARSLVRYFSEAPAEAMASTDRLLTLIKQYDALHRFRMKHPRGVGLPIETVQDLDRLMSLAKALKEAKLPPDDSRRLPDLDASASGLRRLAADLDLKIAKTFPDSTRKDLDFAKASKARIALALDGFDAARRWREVHEAMAFLKSIGYSGDADSAARDLETLIGFHENVRKIVEIETVTTRIRADLDNRVGILANLANASGFDREIVDAWITVATPDNLHEIVKIHDDPSTNGTSEDGRETKRLRHLAKTIENVLHAGPPRSNARMIADLKLKISAWEAWNALSETDRANVNLKGAWLQAGIEIASKRLGENDVLSFETITKWMESREAVVSLRRLTTDFQKIIDTLPGCLVGNRFTQMSFAEGFAKAAPSMTQRDALAAYIESFVVENGLPRWVDEDFKDAVFAIHDVRERQRALDEFRARYDLLRELKLLVKNTTMRDWVVPSAIDMEKAIARMFRSRKVTRSRDDTYVAKGGGTIVLKNDEDFIGIENGSTPTTSSTMSRHDVLKYWNEADIILIDDALDTEGSLMQKAIRSGKTSVFACPTFDGVHETIKKASIGLNPDMRVALTILGARYAPLLASSATRSIFKHDATPAITAAKALTSLLKDSEFKKIAVFTDTSELEKEIRSALAAIDADGAFRNRHRAEGGADIVYETGLECKTRVDAAVIVAKDAITLDLSIPLVKSVATILDERSGTILASKAISNGRLALPCPMPEIVEEFSTRGKTVAFRWDNDLCWMKIDGGAELAVVETCQTMATSANLEGRRAWLVAT